MPRSAARPEATNSLVVIFDKYSDDACAALYIKLEACGALWHFAKLKSFQRCLAVFHDTRDAQTAMRLLNGTTVLGDNKMRMYYSMHTELSQQNNLLNVPDQEKLWLISPPGSPPIDWRQTREHPPNSIHLDHRLEAALKELGLGQFTLDPANISDDESVAGDHAGACQGVEPIDLGSGPRQENQPAPPFVISHGGVDVSEPSSSASSIHEPNEDGRRGSVAAAPTILIQHCDHDSGDTDGAHGLGPNISLANRPPTPGLMSRTSRPPVPGTDTP